MLAASYRRRPKPNLPLCAYAWHIVSGVCYGIAKGTHHFASRVDRGDRCGGRSSWPERLSRGNGTRRVAPTPVAQFLARRSACVARKGPSRTGSGSWSVGKAHSIGRRGARPQKGGRKTGKVTLLLDTTVL